MPPANTEFDIRKTPEEMNLSQDAMPEGPAADGCDASG